MFYFSENYLFFCIICKMIFFWVKLINLDINVFFFIEDFLWKGYFVIFDILIVIYFNVFGLNWKEMFSFVW